MPFVTTPDGRPRQFRHSDAADACAEAFPGLGALHKRGPGCNAPVGTHLILQWWLAGSSGTHTVHGALVVKCMDITASPSSKGTPRSQTAMLLHEEGPAEQYDDVIDRLRDGTLGYAEVFLRFTQACGSNRPLLPTLSDWATRTTAADLIKLLGWAFPGTVPVGGSQPTGGGFALVQIGDLRPFIRLEPQPGQPVLSDSTAQLTIGIEVGQTGSKKFPPTRSPLRLVGLSRVEPSPRNQQQNLYDMVKFFREHGEALLSVCRQP